MLLVSVSNQDAADIDIVVVVVWLLFWLSLHL